MRLAIALVLGCAGSPPPSGPAAARPPTESRPAEAPPVVPPARTEPTHRRLEAPHSGPIAVLAVTADGKAAVSMDVQGGARVWRALDGTREPWIVELPRAAALAIAARGAGFTVGALDEVGGIYLARVGADGAITSHVMLPIEPAPFRRIAMTDRGLLASRADQVLALIGDDGAELDRLSAEPGQRIATVAIGGRRAIAAIETGDGTPPMRRARWVTLEPKLAWGSWIAAGPDVGTEIALSPSGARLAQLRPGVKGSRATVTDTATGKELADLGVTGPGPLGFFDEDHVAVGGDGAITWIDVPAGRADRTPVRGQSRRLGNRDIVVVPGTVVTSAVGDVVVATPAGMRFLGYAHQRPGKVREGADGQLLATFENAYALLDRRLDVVAEGKLDLPDGGNLIDLSRLEGDVWLAIASSHDGGSVSVVTADVARGEIAVAAKGKSFTTAPRYEATTHLVTFGLDLPEVDRYDPVRRTLTRIAGPFEVGDQLELTSPAVAGGMQLVRVLRDGWVELWRDPTRTPDARLKLEGQIVAVDRAARVYTWRSQTAPGAGLAVLADGKPIATLPGNNPVPAPSPTGDQVILIQPRVVALYDLNGNERWEVTVTGIAQALWIGGGNIALSGPTGIAIVDAATGAVTATRCGWQLQLDDAPHFGGGAAESVCGQLR